MIFTCYLNRRATGNWNFPGSLVVKTQLSLQGTWIYPWLRIKSMCHANKTNKQQQQQIERKFLEPNKSENISNLNNFKRNYRTL